MLASGRKPHHTFNSSISTATIQAAFHTPGEGMCNPVLISFLFIYNNYLLLFMINVCAHACARARACACVRACVFIVRRRLRVTFSPPALQSLVLTQHRHRETLSTLPSLYRPCWCPDSERIPARAVPCRAPRGQSAAAPAAATAPLGKQAACAASPARLSRCAS